MTSLNEQIKKIQELRKEIQEDKDFIAKEKASYEEKISIPRERVKEKEYQISCIDTQDVFINIEDIVAEVAKEWGSLPNELHIEIVGDRHFDNNLNDAIMRKITPFYSASEFLLRIKNNNKLFWVKFSMNKTDIQLDGKSFEEHIIAKPSGSGKVCSVDDWKNIVLRIRFDSVLKIEENNIEYQGDRGKILARAILRKEERENTSQTKNEADEIETE